MGLAGWLILIALVVAGVMLAEQLGRWTDKRDPE
jgi:hypothetical protein